MNNTSYQVSDASIKRYHLLKVKIFASDERILPKDVFSRWAKSEKFCKITRWEALQAIAKEDYSILEYVISELRQKTENLSKIGEAFLIINEINA